MSPYFAWWAWKRSEIWSLVLWIAGAMMWLGGSSASWMMYSPRSVSIGSNPAASSASLSATSSPTMDLPLVIRFAPAARQMSMTMARISAGVLAQCTWPPCSRTRSSKRSR